MTDPNTATPTPQELSNSLTEMDKLKLQLAKEKQQRFQAEAMNLQMAKRSLDAQHAALEVENKVFFDRLKLEYALAPADEISEDGTIKRSPVRSLKEG